MRNTQTQHVDTVQRVRDKVRGSYTKTLDSVDLSYSPSKAQYADVTIRELHSVICNLNIDRENGYFDKNFRGFSQLIQ